MGEIMSKRSPLELLDGQIEEMVARAEQYKFQGAGPEQLARHFIKVRELYDALDEVNKKISDLKRRMAEELIPGAFEDAGVSTITLKEGYRITTSAFVRASTRNMEAGIAWMKGHGMADVVKETINASTLAAVAKSMMQDNRELPDELFNVYVGTNTSLTKIK